MGKSKSGNRKTSKQLNDAYNENMAKRRKAISTGELDVSKYYSPNSKTKKIKFNQVRLSKKRKKKLKNTTNFYNSKEWRRIRYEALKLHGRQCLCCGQKAPNVELHVDHIKPRSKYPDLELDINNLQILCKDCNLGKSNRDSIDYRLTIDERLDLKMINDFPIMA